MRLNRQEFLHKVRDIAGEDAPALRHALKQLAVDRSPSAPPGESPQLGNGFHLPSTELSSADLAAPGEAGASSAIPNGVGAEAWAFRGFRQALLPHLGPCRRSRRGTSAQAFRQLPARRATPVPRAVPASLTGP